MERRNNNKKFGSSEIHINGLEVESRVIDFVLYITMWVERVRIKICRKTRLKRKKMRYKKELEETSCNKTLRGDWLAGKEQICVRKVWETERRGKSLTCKQDKELRCQQAHWHILHMLMD